MSFGGLPDELVVEALAYTDPAALSRFSRASRDLQRFMQEESLVQQVFRKYNRDHSLDPEEYDRYTFGEERDHVEDYKRGVFKDAFGDNYKEAKRVIEGHVGKTLNLPHKGLKLLPKEIGQLKQLKTLDLGDNKLTNLPKEIGQLEQLKTLRLDDNKLTNLPKVIGKLVKLRFLHLNDNALTRLPKEMDNLVELRYLALNGNKIEKISDKLADLVRNGQLFINI